MEPEMYIASSMVSDETDDEEMEKKRSNKDGRRLLTWRDKEENFSDWTLIVSTYISPTTKTIVKAEGSIKRVVAAEADDTISELTFELDGKYGTRRLGEESPPVKYHVHRNVMACNSGYFKNLFTTPLNSQEQQSSISFFELDGLACDAFPMMLDYLYAEAAGIGESVVIGVEFAAALRFLASYFDIPSLRNKVNEEFENLLTPNNCLGVLKQAEVFDDRAMGRVVADYAWNFAEIPLDFIFSLSFPLLESVLKSEERAPRLFDPSLGIFDYLVENDFRPNSHEFNTLTACNIMSYVNFEAACLLLQVMATVETQTQVSNEFRLYMQRCCNDENNTMYSSGTFECSACSKINCLLDRCIERVARECKHLIDDDDDDTVIEMFSVSQLKMIVRQISKNEKLNHEQPRKVIEVKGGGIQYVNGLYVYSGIYDDFIEYSKPTIIQGKKSMTYLRASWLKASDGSFEKCWTLGRFLNSHSLNSTKRKTNYGGGSQLRVYYKAPIELSEESSSEEDKHPTDCQWEVHCISSSDRKKSLPVPVLMDYQYDKHENTTIRSPKRS